MTLILLAWSPDSEFVEQLTAWSDQNPRFNLIRINSYEEIPATLAAKRVDVLLLDNANDEIPLLSFTHTLVANQPGIKVLVYSSPIEMSDAELEAFKSAGISGWLSKPFSPEELTGRLTETETSAGKSPDLDAVVYEEGINEALSTDATDMSFLKGWMIEEPPVESPPETKGEPDVTNKIEVNALSPSTMEPIPGEVLEPVLPQTVVDESIPSGEDEQVDSDAQHSDLSETTPEVEPASIEETAELPAPAEALEIETQTEPVPASSIAPPVAQVPETQPAAVEENEEVPFNIHTLRLPYCCLLIPRDPQQYLTRDIAERLGLLLPQIHLEHGWRVTGMAVRPLYLQWNILLPAEDCPTDAINEVRKITSLQLFTLFPELKPVSETQDFWAPGYLVLSGTQPFPSSLIQEFIQRTRNSPS